MASIVRPRPKAQLSTVVGGVSGGAVLPGVAGRKQRGLALAYDLPVAEGHTLILLRSAIVSRAWQLALRRL